MSIDMNTLISQMIMFFVILGCGFIGAKGFIYILLKEKKDPIRLEKRDIYYFCVSRNYNKKNISQI